MCLSHANLFWVWAISLPVSFLLGVVVGKIDKWNINSITRGEEEKMAAEEMARNRVRDVSMIIKNIFEFAQENSRYTEFMLKFDDEKNYVSPGIIVTLSDYRFEGFVLMYFDPADCNLTDSHEECNTLIDKASEFISFCLGK